MGHAWKLPHVNIGPSASAMDTGRVTPWGISFLQIPLIWQSVRGAGVTVGIADCGIDGAHPDFAGAIRDAKDFTGSPYGFAPAPMNPEAGHGTHVAGTIGARDNGQGIVGIAPDCELLIAKVLGDNGSGDGSMVSAGIDWLVASGAHVISMSLGSPVGDPQIQASLLKAVSAGVLVVCAAGNDGKIADAAGNEQDTIGYPAAWGDLALAVGAIDNQNQIASFSSRGPQLDTMAPGVHILSCWPGNRYAYLDGTSMATPHVTGCIALALAYRMAHSLPLFGSQAKLADAIDNTSIAMVAGHAPSPDWGYGVINPAALLQPAAPSTNLPAFHFGPQVIGGYSFEVIAKPVGQ